MVSCAPKAENNTFDQVNPIQFSYAPKNVDRQFDTEFLENFRFESATGLELSQRRSSPWMSGSADIFRFAENSILLGNAIGEPANDLNEFGHRLLHAFYSSDNTSTQFNQSNSMYLPAALGFEGHKIKALFEEIATSENLSGTKNALAQHHIVWPPEQPTLRPIGFINSIKAYLENIPVELQRNGVSNSFINIFKAQLEKEYLGAIRSAQKSLVDIDQNQRLEINARVISDVIKTLNFIPKSAVEALEQNLVKAKRYAEWIEPEAGESHAHRLVKVIANIWIDLNPQQREKYIRSANEMLYEKMNTASNKMISWLADRTELSLTDKEYYYGRFFRDGFADRLGTSCHADIERDLRAWVSMSEAQKVVFRRSQPDLFSVFSRYSSPELRTNVLNNFDGNVFGSPLTNGGVVRQFISDVRPICIVRVQALLDRSVNLYLLSELDIEIRRLGDKIEEVVVGKTIGSLNDIAESVQSPDKFKTFFTSIASPILDEMLFEGGTLDGIEDSRVSLLMGPDKKIEMRKVSGGYVSGAETLGTSLAANYYRFLGMPEYENASPISKDYYQAVFGQLNKMISMVGFRTIDNELVESLHRSFYGNIPDFDVFKYECSPEKKQIQDERKARYQSALRAGEKPDPNDYVGIREDCTGYEDYHKNIYQIPDQFALNGPFSIETAPTYSSIRAQAEIIRGGALMLNYFNDWRGPNDFDQGLGQEAYSDIELFPKSAFVNLAVAVMTGPLRGLQKENSALRLFNGLGEEMKDWVADGLPDPSAADPNQPVNPAEQITGAVVVDLLSSGPSEKVKSLDMAAFMVAIDEFLKATDGIEDTEASVINPPDRTVKDNMESILKGRRLLKLMMFSMANFLKANLQGEDGGFWEEYNLTTQQVNKTRSRSLETQLTVIDALLRTYRMWGGEVAAVSAVEAYHFINHALWNEDRAFYNISEAAIDSDRPVSPDLYLKAILTMKTVIPFLQNAQSAYQANRMFDYYSKAFLQWSRAQ